MTFECSGSRGLGYYAGGYFNLGYERQSEASARPGTSVFAGAIIEQDGFVFARRENGILRLPGLSLHGHTSARSALIKFLDQTGMAVDVGRVYSVFDDAVTGEHFIYFRAKAVSTEGASDLERLPINRITGESWKAAPQARMMTRFAQEFQTNVFGLYIGDSNAGEVHADILL
jgi:hypothetical protein